MIKLVEEAEKNKAPIVRIADKWAKILVPVALGSSLLIGLLTKDIYRAVTALVVFCPCSLVLATPTAIMAAIGNATKKGILIKSGAAIETTAKVNAFVMDKTGTLTYGKLAVEDIYVFDENIEHKNFLSITASAEKFSEHPLAKAILSYTKGWGIVAKDPESFEIQSGKGVAATVDGHKILIGEKIIGENLIKKTPEINSLIEQMEKQGKTVLPVAIDQKVAGIITVADKIRSEASETIKSLKKLGIPHIIMLTGDNEVVANSIGASAGVTEVLASQLPQDKVNSVKNLKDKGYVVGMVGDGVNDAPALATSSVSIAMGAIGSDVAIEAAEIALMGDDISKLPFLVRICRKAKNRIIFNIIISMVINFGAIIFAGFGLLNPVTAALVHNFGSVFVVLSSVLLLTYKEKAKI
jgi:heavy metal translocating P-type ATPase